MPLSTELVGVEPYVFLTISACTDRKINRNGVKTSVNYIVYIIRMYIVRGVSNKYSDKMCQKLFIEVTNFLKMSFLRSTIF